MACLTSAENLIGFLCSSSHSPHPYAGHNLCHLALGVSLTSSAKLPPFHVTPTTAASALSYICQVCSFPETLVVVLLPWTLFFQIISMTHYTFLLLFQKPISPQCHSSSWAFWPSNLKYQTLPSAQHAPPPYPNLFLFLILTTSNNVHICFFIVYCLNLFV